MNDPVAELLAICRRLVDPNAQPITVHAGHNGTAVLRATTATGEVVIKRHRGPDRHRQEVHAYQHWVPAMQGRAPRLLAVNDDPPAIVATALPGQILAEARLAPAQELDAYRQAGELLRDLHRAAEPRTEPDMTQWLAARGEHWLALAEDILSAHRRTEIRSHLRALAQLGPVPAVPCHLDYTPRNLLATTGGAIAVIDFEHARYDLAARDLVRIATRVWPARRHLEDAFLQAYGPLTDLDRQIIEHCAHLDALTNAVRARRSFQPTSTSRLDPRGTMHVTERGSVQGPELRDATGSPDRG